MPIENAEIQLASGWPNEDRTEFFENRERILIDANGAQGIVPIESVRENAAKLLASLSLLQEGHLVLDAQTPGLLLLTESGRRFARGAAALQYGDD